MASEYYLGETVRITAADLTHSDDGPVTAGATVTVTLHDATGAQLSSTSATADGNDWHVDLSSPDDPGIYTAKVTADVDGVIWRDKVQLAYKLF